MDKTSEEKFLELMKRDKNTLNSGELEFIMARRDYMNDADKERFADEIEAHESNIGKGEKSLEEMSSRELKAKAKSLDIEVPRGMTDEDLIEAIKEAEAGE